MKPSDSAIRSYSLYREDVKIQNLSLPVNLSLRKNSSQSHGCALHWHEELEFYYVKKGGVSLLCGGRQRWLYPGQAGFVNWCEPHRGTAFLDHTEHYIIQISPELFSDERISLPNSASTYSFLSLFISQRNALPCFFDETNPIISQLECLIRALEEQRMGFEFAVKSSVYGIFSFLLNELSPFASVSANQKDVSALSHIRKILVFLSEHYMEPDAVRLPSLSQRFGLSVPYLCRMFKKYTNLTLTSYINELRCFHAATLIQNGSSLENAAYGTGFQDYNYFSRLFKQVLGNPPSYYKAHRPLKSPQEPNPNRI